MRIQGHRRPGQLLWLALPLLVACGTLRKLSPDTVISMLDAAASGDSQEALNRATGGILGPDAERMMRTFGPLAVQAVGAIHNAIARRQAEKRAREVRDEEDYRQHIADLKHYFASQCTRSVPESGKAGAGATDPDDPATLESQADTAFGRGDYREAEQKIEHAYNLRNKQLGPGHPDTARTAHKVAIVELARDNYEIAGKFALVALKASEDRLKAIKPTTPPQPAEITAFLDVAEATSTMATVYRHSSDYDDAKSAYYRALELRTRPGYLDTDHLCVAESQNELGELLQITGNYPEAIMLFRKALSIREHKLGRLHPDTAQSYSNLASYYRSTSDYNNAKEYYRIALDIRIRLGEDYPDIAESFDEFGNFYKIFGDYSKAERLYKKALEIRHDKLDRLDESLETARFVVALAGLYQTMGEYDKGEELYKSAYDIRKKKLGMDYPDHPDIAESLGDLGDIALARGDAAKARCDDGKTKCDLAMARSNDAKAKCDGVKVEPGDTEAEASYKKAECWYNRALVIRRKRFSYEHPLVAESLVALGRVHLARGDYVNAGREYNQALKILTKKRSHDHPEVARVLFRLGELHQIQGDYVSAEHEYEQALDIREKKLDDPHPEVAESLTQLSTLMVATGRGGQAIKYLRRAIDISERFLGIIGTASGDSRMEALLRTLRAQEEIAYSLACSKCSVGAQLIETPLLDDVAHLAISVALLRKGRSIDEAANLSRAVYQSRDPKTMQMNAHLRALEGEIRNLTYSASDKDTPLADECLRSTRAPAASLRDKSDKDKRVAKRKCLDNQVENLKQELARSSESRRAPKRIFNSKTIVSGVAEKLNTAESLVEIVAFRPHLFHTTGKGPRHGELRYLAMILHPDDKVCIVDLGPGEAVNKAIDTFLKLIVPPKDAPDEAQFLRDSNRPMLESAKELYQLVFQPMHQSIKVDKSIFLSLDSQLNLVPFAALFDGKKYLVDSHQLIYLTSGRDLLRRDENPQHDVSITLIANPDLSDQAQGHPSHPSPQSVASTRGVKVMNDVTPHEPVNDMMPQELEVSGARSLPLNAPLDSLSDTDKEVTDIKSSLPTEMRKHVQIIEGKQATRKAFLTLEHPDILHVATHGYFDESAAVKDPLLRSMLLLAGADGGTKLLPEGLATALEVSRMDLWGTELVVLAACKTGVGDVSNLGEGVYGLRRAVMAAGAETLITSLWDVDSQVTGKLMVQYYKNLFAGKGRSEAMRMSVKWARERYKHPYYWAPFIVIGSSERLARFTKKRSAGTTKQQSDEVAKKHSTSTGKTYSRIGKMHSTKELP